MTELNFGPNARRCALTAKQLRSLSLAKTKGQGRMWTTGQFSKLTGVSKRTLQNWSQEPDAHGPNAKSKSESAALLAAARQDPDNGYRTYDVNSLFEVAMIRLGQDSGLSQDELRKITRGAAPEALASMQSHIDRLIAQRNELDRKIKLIRMVAAMHAVRGTRESQETPDEFASFGLIGLIGEEFLDALALAGECGADLAGSDFDPESARKAFDGLVESWAAGQDSTSDQAQRAFALWHAELSKLFDTLERTAFANSVVAWLSGGYSPTLLTLRFGEGIAEWLLETAGTAASSTMR